jgi:hypothetical protein
VRFQVNLRPGETETEAPPTIAVRGSSFSYSILRPGVVSVDGASSRSAALKDLKRRGAVLPKGLGEGRQEIAARPGSQLARMYLQVTARRTPKRLAEIYPDYMLTARYYAKYDHRDPRLTWAESRRRLKLMPKVRRAVRQFVRSLGLPRVHIAAFGSARTLTAGRDSDLDILFFLPGYTEDEQLVFEAFLEEQVAPLAAERGFSINPHILLELGQERAADPLMFIGDVGLFDAPPGEQDELDWLDLDGEDPSWAEKGFRLLDDAWNQHPSAGDVVSSVNPRRTAS